MRKRDEGLRDALLEQAREMIDAEGPEALNMRALAARAGIASGTVYNYFAGKDDILLALTEEYWREALAEMRGEIHADKFCDQLCEIYAFLKSRVAGSAGMLMGSLGDVEAAGRRRMQTMQQALRAALMERMRGDKGIRPDVWNEALTEEEFAGFIIMNMMDLLRMNAPNIDTFIEIVKRILY